jgi:hypothetical protein
MKKQVLPATSARVGVGAGVGTGVGADVEAGVGEAVLGAVMPPRASHSDFV